MKTIIHLLCCCVFFCCVSVAQTEPVANPEATPWNFAVSGDSRNCGNVVMPAIAAGAKNDRAAFYWHLGDLRAIYGPDEDYKAEPEHHGQPVDKNAYLANAWPDFVASQMQPFQPLPFFVGIGNHETTPPKTRAEFTSFFARWLDTPVLQKQRLTDNPQSAQARTYYHWIQGGVDFIYLDNATNDQFDSAQIAWLEGVLHRAKANPRVKSVVVGMHKMLPDSIAFGHSMSDTPQGTSSGRRVYNDLLALGKQSHKPVYILASHSHFYMSGVFRTDYWKHNGGELPGWIVGTAGAMRYALPPGFERAEDARQNVYGYLLGSVRGDGSIDFKFQQLEPDGIHRLADPRFGAEFVDYCIKKNSEVKEDAAGAR
ncbi:MAG TPA: hypothetical protein VFL42_10005 [Terriglobales bacterium]|nr:hypothetical protein [Terriglobales bacterium]